MDRVIRVLKLRKGVRPFCLSCSLLLTGVLCLSAQDRVSKADTVLLDTVARVAADEMYSGEDSVRRRVGQLPREISPFSYEDFVFTLNEVASLPLEEVEEECDQKVMQRTITFLKANFDSDQLAYAEYSRGNGDGLASAKAERVMALCSWDKSKREVLESVYANALARKMELIRSIGADNFIEKYAAMMPLLLHLDLQAEVALKASISEEEHRNYFERMFANRISEQENTGGESCSCACLFHVNPSCLENDYFSRKLMKGVKYPMFAQQRNIQGKVWIGFTVNLNGSTSDVHVVKGVHMSLDKESSRVVNSLSSLPPVCPVHGRKVAVRYVVPIVFRMR